MLYESDIRAALRVCFVTLKRYPVAVNAVDFGMVQAIELHEDPDAPGVGIPGVPVPQRLRIMLLSPTDDQDALSLLKAQILNRMAGIEGLSRIDLVFATDSQWGPELLSPEARKTLGIDRGLFPILTRCKV